MISSNGLAIADYVWFKLGRENIFNLIDELQLEVTEAPLPFSGLYLAIQPTISDTNTTKSYDKIIELVRQNFDLRPYAITNMLDLLHPMYRATAAYGHFGRDPYEMTVGGKTFTAFPWEKTDRAAALKDAAGI